MSIPAKQEGFTGQRSCVLPQDIVRQIARHLLCENLYITDIGYYPKAAFHQRERRQGCPQHILIYCLQGAGWFELGDGHYLVGTNDFFILPADKPHRYGADLADPWSIYWVHFTGSKADHYLSYLQKSGPGPINVLPRDERFQLFDDIMAHLEMSFNEDNLVYANNSLAHFLSSFKNSVFTPLTVSPAQIDQDPVSRTIAYMKLNLDKNLTLQELSDVAGMSPSHYSAVFRRKVQSAPVNFFTFLKMQQACRLLEYTSLRIKEVAYQTGYSDPYHFSRVFTGMMGVSPRNYRKVEKT